MIQNAEVPPAALEMLYLWSDQSTHCQHRGRRYSELIKNIYTQMKSEIKIENFKMYMEKQGRMRAK